MINTLIEKALQIESNMKMLKTRVDIEQLTDEVYSVYAVEEMEKIFKEDITNEKLKMSFLNWLVDYTNSHSNDAFRDFLFLCLSTLLVNTKNPEYANLLIDEIHRPEYGPHAGLFLFNQIKRLYITTGLNGRSDKVDDLYWEVVEAWSDVLSEYLSPIPKENRNKNRVVVVMLHFLNKTIAPTKTALERIKTLQDEMGKEVLCIHSREQYTNVGSLPFYGIVSGTCDERFNGLHTVDIEGQRIDLYQPPYSMPDYDEYIKIIGMIREYAPYEVIVLGDNCVLGDLCAQMIPTVCIPMMFSSVPIKRINEYVSVGKHLTEKDKEKINNAGGNEDSYIESTFTFELISQKKKLSRRELDLPENKFIVSVVGIRLDYDVTEEFLNKLIGLTDKDIHIAFAGKYESYNSICENNEKLKEHSTFVGYQDDILAFQEVCNLYANPPRTGGGFSVVEAFYMHKPGVTLPYGDVAASSGKEFWVNDLDEMMDMIIKYKEDKEFYKKMSEKAYARSLELFDSKGALQHILHEVENGKLFF